MSLDKTTIKSFVLQKTQVYTKTADSLSVTVRIYVNPLETQIAGTHYKGFKIQPVEYIHANNIPYMEANVIKYVTRWKLKNGVSDLEKARHYIDLLIELENK